MIRYDDICFLQSFSPMSSGPRRSLRLRNVNLPEDDSEEPEIQVKAVAPKRRAAANAAQTKNAAAPKSPKKKRTRGEKKEVKDEEMDDDDENREEEKEEAAQSDQEMEQVAAPDPDESDGKVKEEQETAYTSSRPKRRCSVAAAKPFRKIASADGPSDADDEFDVVKEIAGRKKITKKEKESATTSKSTVKNGEKNADANKQPPARNQKGRGVVKYEDTIKRKTNVIVKRVGLPPSPPTSSKIFVSKGQIVILPVGRGFPSARIDVDLVKKRPVVPATEWIRLEFVLFSDSVYEWITIEARTSLIARDLVGVLSQAWPWPLHRDKWLVETQKKMTVTQRIKETVDKEMKAQEKEENYDNGEDDEWKVMETVDGEGDVKTMQVVVEKEGKMDWKSRWLKQEVNKAMRVRHENLHKTHLLSYMSHLRHLAAMALSQTSKQGEVPMAAIALSMIPSDGKKTKKERMELIEWWWKEFELFEEAEEEEERSEEELLSERMMERKFTNHKDAAIMFFSLASAAGFTARIVCRCQVMTKKVPESPDAKKKAEVKEPTKKRNGAYEQSRDYPIVDYWVEIWDECTDSWTPIDVIRPQSPLKEEDEEDEEESRLQYAEPLNSCMAKGGQVLYMLAIDNEFGIRDVSARYIHSQNFVAKEFRNRRAKQEWLNELWEMETWRAHSIRACKEDDEWLSSMKVDLPKLVGQHKEGGGEVCRFPYQYKSQHNIGNSCYMNAALQVLAACPLFVMQVDQAKESLKKPSVFFTRFGASMMWLNGLHNSRAPVTKGFLEGMRTDLMKLDRVFEEGDGKAQQDAEEALTAFLGAVSDECTGLGFRKRDSMASRLSLGISSPVKTSNPIKRRSGEGHSVTREGAAAAPAVGEEQPKTKMMPATCDPIDLMEVQMRDVRTCRSCGHVNYFEAVEHRVHLGVGVAEKKRKPWTVKCVEQLLAAEVAVEEIITDYGCEKCATKGIEAVGTKQFVVFGEYIIIVLKRFGHDENHRLRKLTMPIRVPIYLEMADFLGGGRAAEHNPLNKTIDIDDNETSVKKGMKKKEEIKKVDPAEKMKKETDNWVDLPSEDEKVSLSTTIDEFHEGEKMEYEEEKEGNETMEDDGEKKEEEEGAADETEIVQLSSSASAEIVDDNPAATEATSLETQNSDACVAPITRSKRAPRLETPGTVEVTAMSRSEAEKFKSTPTTRKRVRSPPSRGKDERASTVSRLSLSDTRLEKRSRLEEKKKLTGSSAASSPVVVDDVDIIIDEAAMEERERSRRSSMEKKNPIWAAVKEEVKALPKKDPFDFDEFDSDNEAGDVARPTKQAAAGKRKLKLQRKPLTHQNGHVKKEKESPSKGTGDRRKMKNENISPLNSSMEQTGGGGRRKEESDDDRKKAKREEEEEVDGERIGGDLDKVTRRSRARSNRMSTIVIEQEEEEDGEDIFLEGNTAVDQKGEPEEPMEYGSQEGRFVKEEEEAEECSSADEVVQATPPDAIEQEEEKEGAEKSNNEMKVESMEEEEERYVKTETTATETDATTESSLPDEDDVFGSDFTDRHERGDLSSSKTPRTSTSTTVVEETKIEESSALNDLLEEMEMGEENEKKEEVPNDQTDFEKAFRTPEWNERMAEWRALFKDTDPSPPRDYMTFRPVDDRWMMDMCNQLHLDCVITRYDQHPVFAELRAQSNLCPVTTKPQADDVIDMDGDGNCLFRAISWWVTGAEAGHELMRFRIVDFMVKFPDQFGERMSGEPGRKYTKEDNEMLKDGEWGTQCEIYGAATLLGVDIYTYHEKRWKAYRPLFEWTLEDGTPQVIRKTGVTERTRFALYLTNPENLHYDVVKYMKPVAPMSDTCYRLLATILHEGETSVSGHYIADVYDHEKDQWVHCDDERITKRDILEVLEDAMQLGYVLIYGKNSSVLEKQKKKK